MRGVPHPARVLPLVSRHVTAVPIVGLSGHLALTPADRLWTGVEPLCGQAFEARVREGSEASDQRRGRTTSAVVRRT